MLSLCRVLTRLPLLSCSQSDGAEESMISNEEAFGGPEAAFGGPYCLYQGILNMPEAFLGPDGYIMALPSSGTINPFTKTETKPPLGDAIELFLHAMSEEKTTWRDPVSNKLYAQVSGRLWRLR